MISDTLISDTLSTAVTSAPHRQSVLGLGSSRVLTSSPYLTFLTDLNLALLALTSLKKSCFSLSVALKHLAMLPPGTGKTLTATLLGNETGKPVFRIDLSMVISKYIGETEKNLSNLFDKAQNKNWILFFDEADALFGKRTSVKDAHDRYANQEVAYLLQRIEDYPGLTILASNFKSNIDDAFLRRFNAIIYFPMPQYEERLTLWQKAFPEQVHFAQDVNFEQLAKQYPLSGSHIMNIVHYVCLQSLVKKTTLVTQASVVQGIQREIAKEGKMG